MAATLILAILATAAGQITAQSDKDVTQLIRDQENLQPPPTLPAAEGKSILGGGMYTQCYCRYGVSMCVRNPYDAAEVRCLFACYKQSFPTLDLNYYQWICPVRPYRAPQVRRDDADTPAINHDGQHSHDGLQRPIYLSPPVEPDAPQRPLYLSNVGEVNAPYTGSIDGPNRGPVNNLYPGPVDESYKVPNSRRQLSEAAFDNAFQAQY